MTNKILWGVAVVALVLSGYATFHSPAPVNFGSTSAYQALNNQNLLSVLQTMNTDAAAIRAPLAGLVTTTTAAIAFPSIASTTGAVTSTGAISIAALMGDLILIQPSTSTPGVYFNAQVTTPSTTAATFQISAMNQTGAAVTPSSTTFTFWVLPKASFLAPAALTQ